VIRSTFFRQSAWMLFASLAGGGLLALVHRAAGRMGEGEYGLFTIVLNSLQGLAFPSLGLAAVFTQMTASARTDEARRDVAATARWALGAMFVVWLLLSGFIAVRHEWLMAKFGIATALPLVWLVPTLLLTLINPIALGLVQGKQDFLTVGISAILGGGGRLVFVWSLVWFVGGTAGWAICGVFFGMVVGFLPLFWGSRTIWLKRGGTFRFAAWIRDTGPLTAGLSAAAFLFSLDTITAGEFLSKSDKDLYGAAATVGRVVMWISAPLVMVMFPKIAGSIGTGDDRRVLFQTVGATLLVAGGAALACTLLPSVPLLVLQGKKLAATAAPLIPAYVWCLLPLSLSNVLLNNLLARRRYTVVPPLLLVVGAYWLALRRFNSSPKEIILTMGAASVVALVVCIGATWLGTERPIKTPN
jgi:O-antigen/teichoic acid export membrane protein